MTSRDNVQKFLIIQCVKRSTKEPQLMMAGNATVNARGISPKQCSGQSEVKILHDP